MSASVKGEPKFALCKWRNLRYAVKSMSNRGDVYLWLCYVVKPMSSGSRSPSIKIKSSDH